MRSLNHFTTKVRFWGNLRLKLGARNASRTIARPTKGALEQKKNGGTVHLKVTNAIHIRLSSIIRQGAHCTETFKDVKRVEDWFHEYILYTWDGPDEGNDERKDKEGKPAN